MQLKKRYSVRKGVAAGAMAVAMFATSMPAMASNGFGLGLGVRGRAQVDQGDDDHQGEFEGRGMKLGIGLGADIRTELKSIRKELKDAAKLFRRQEKADRSASATEEVAALKQCRAQARETYDASLKTARDERDAGLRTARTEYLSALRAARAKFQAAIGLNLSGADGSATATAIADFTAARETYVTEMRAAYKKFSETKKGVQAAYHEETKAARTALDAVVSACK